MEAVSVTDAGPWQPEIIEQQTTSPNIPAEHENPDNISGEDLPQAGVVAAGIDPAAPAAEAGGSDSAPPEGDGVGIADELEVLSIRRVVHVRGAMESLFLALSNDN